MNKTIAIFYASKENNKDNYYKVEESIVPVSVEERSRTIASYGMFNFLADVAKSDTDYVGIFSDGFYLVSSCDDQVDELNSFSAYSDYFYTQYKNDDIVFVGSEQLKGFKNVQDYKEHLLYDHSCIDVCLKSINKCS